MIIGTGPQNLLDAFMIAANYSKISTKNYVTTAAVFTYNSTKIKGGGGKPAIKLNNNANK